jgi:CheY-like chemotaxis protein
VGSTFTVTFPSRPELLDASATADPTFEDALLAKVRVLVVDADSGGREMLTLALEQHGARVTAVGSEGEALALLGGAGRHELPHVIVSDVGEASDADLTLVREIGRLPGSRSIPAIGLTEYDEPRIKARVLASGFHTHLSKPLLPKTLALAIGHLVDRL